MPTVEELKALAIEEIDKRKEEIIGHAKHILNNPEVGFTEFKTSKYGIPRYQRYRMFFRGVRANSRKIKSCSKKYLKSFR